MNLTALIAWHETRLFTECWNDAFREEGVTVECGMEAIKRACGRQQQMYRQRRGEARQRAEAEMIEAFELGAA